MRELFTKIDSDTHIQPGSKVIPAKAFTSLLSADELIEEAKKESETFRKKVEQEAAELKEKEAKKGFEEGLNKWTLQITQLEAEQRSLRDEMQRQIVELVLECGKKILGRELKSSPESIIDIVSQALRPVATHRHATIFVAKEDAEMLEKNKKKLHEELEQTETLAISVRSDIEPGGCVIETESGIINAQLDVLWESLELALNQVLRKE